MIENNDNMPNMEAQGMLSRLLARENIRIQHGNFRTAFFDVESRVLGLPLWQNKGKAVYDMLCGHEIGHALYTPKSLLANFHRDLPGVRFDILNIVEDIRIERMIQETYPGLSASFRQAYSVLAADNFFGTRGKNLETLCFADRLNIYAKAGANIPVVLNVREMGLYNAAYAAKTPEDVLGVCHLMVAYVKELAQRNNPTPSAPKKPKASSVPTPQPVDNDKEEPSMQEELPASPEEPQNNNNHRRPVTDEESLDASMEEEKEPMEEEPSTPPEKDELAASTAKAFDDAIASMNDEKKKEVEMDDEDDTDEEVGGDLSLIHI